MAKRDELEVKEDIEARSQSLSQREELFRQSMVDTNKAKKDFAKDRAEFEAK